MEINEQRVIDTFLGLVRIDSPSKQEEVISQHLAAALTALGGRVERDAMGNVLGRFAGQGEPIILNAHMDTVGQDTGIKPMIKEGVIYSDGTTILGGDDKSGVAVILEVLRMLQNVPAAQQPALEVLFTVSEEIGLVGARHFDTTKLVGRKGVVLDEGGPIGSIVVAAPFQDNHEIRVTGKSSHAGAEPENGISAIEVAATAINLMALGRIDPETTANVGIIKGGTATNIVTASLYAKSEARSLDETKLAVQTEKMRQAWQCAASLRSAQVDVQVTREYNGYHFSAGHPWIAYLAGRMAAAGFEPRLEKSGGGSDANIFNSKGLTMVVISTGMSAVHTPKEHIDIQDIVDATKSLWSIVTGLV